jgi:hypothetical protein
MLVQKNIRETERELAHTDLYFNGVFIGYIIKNNSTLAVKNENWNFVSKNSCLKSTFDKTKQLLLLRITNLCNEVIK